MTCSSSCVQSVIPDQCSCQITLLSCPYSIVLLCPTIITNPGSWCCAHDSPFPKCIWSKGQLVFNTVGGKQMPTRGPLCLYMETKALTADPGK